MDKIWSALQNIATQLGQVATAFRSGPNAPPVYTFSTLPSASSNPWKVVACSNARKPSEGAGSGTGMVLFSDGSNWISTAGTVAAS